MRPIVEGPITLERLQKVEYPRYIDPEHFHYIPKFEVDLRPDDWRCAACKASLTSNPDCFDVTNVRVFCSNKDCRGHTP